MVLIGFFFFFNFTVQEEIIQLSLIVVLVPVLKAAVHALIFMISKLIYFIFSRFSVSALIIYFFCVLYHYFFKHNCFPNY